MRSKRALLSFIFSTISQVINIVLSLFVRRLFIQIIGTELLGLNSLYSSIVSFLSISELGIGQSISMCLYKAIANDDKEAIKSYMRVLKKIYYAIGIIVMALGAAFSPFVFVVTDVSQSNLFLSTTFVLYTFAVAISYFFSYKKILLSAEQKNHIVAFGQLVYHLVLNITQLIIILVLKNYYFFLMAIAFLSTIENIVVSRICTKMHPDLFLKANKLSKEQKTELIGKVKGMMLYKISNYLIQSADNIIISIIVGTIFVAYYSNYHLIINLLFSVFSNVAASSIAGLGNILYSDKNNLKFAFSKLLLIQNLVFTLSTVCFIALSDPFVTIVFGENLNLSFITILLMAISFDIKGYSFALETLRESAGLYNKDKYLNLMVAVLNVGLSVALAFPFGIGGVIIGTIICYIIKELIIVPNIVFTDILPGEKKWYYKKVVFHFLLSFILTVGVCGIHFKFFNKVSIVYWILEAVLYTSICGLVGYAAYCNTDEFKALWSSFKNMLKRKEAWTK